jgi:hypothetical protein
MKLWIDDVRTPPAGYYWCKSVNRAKAVILEYSNKLDWDMIPTDYIELIDVDHDAGDFVNDGGDYIRLLDWLEEMGYNYPIRIHSMNPVGRANMEAICRKNNWKILR